MRLSSSVILPSAVAVLAAVLLCGPAVSQTTTGDANSLPRIRVEPVEKPHRPKQVTNTVANTVTYRESSVIVQTRSPLPDTPLGKIAELERAASSCNGGCETSMKSGDAPWVGCSETGPEITNFSPTCRDTLTYKHYTDCRDTKAFLGWDRNKIWWQCSSLLAGGKFQVAELKRSKPSR